MLTQDQVDRGIFFRPPWNFDDDVELQIDACATEVGARNISQK